MYKTVSRFMNNNPGVGVRGSRYDGLLPSYRVPKATHAVVFFRVQLDNQRRECVYRFLKSFVEEARAETFFADVQAQYKVLLHRERVVRDEGDAALLETWRAARRGLNKVVDPLLGRGGYGTMERVGEKYFDLPPSVR